MTLRQRSKANSGVREWAENGKPSETNTHQQQFFKNEHRHSSSNLEEQVQCDTINDNVKDPDCSRNTAKETAVCWKKDVGGTGVKGGGKISLVQKPNLEVKGKNNESHTAKGASDESSNSFEDEDDSSDKSEMLLPRCMYNVDRKTLKLLKDAIKIPPVTRDSLRELDLDSIQNNVNLRVDICYDHDLYFQPVSGRKGDLKRAESSDFWASIAIELRVYEHNTRQSCHLCNASLVEEEDDLSFEPRLSDMFEELRNLLEVLVPESDREEVANHLDTALIMQQVYVGSLDVVRLSDWLSGLLTTHCAPMRDHMAEEMKASLSVGARTNDAELLVDGLEKLFAFCEAMKLDVSNHQIRTFRWPLIEDTIPFQIDCFERMRDNGRLDLRGAKRWFETAWNEAETQCKADLTSGPSSQFEVFISAVADLCDPAYNRLPITFHYDKQRFARLQEDITDLVQLQICMSLFDFVLDGVGIRHDQSLLHVQLAERIMLLTDDEASNGSSISENIEGVATEIARYALEIADSATDSISDPTKLNSDFQRVVDMLRAALDRERQDNKVMTNTINRFADLTIQNALKFFPLNTLEISNAQRQWLQSRLGNGHYSIVPSLEDMARRLAHIGVVHWKVWSDIVYLNDSVEISTDCLSFSEDEDDGDGENCDIIHGKQLGIEVESTSNVFVMGSSGSLDFGDNADDPDCYNNVERPP